MVDGASDVDAASEPGDAPADTADADVIDEPDLTPPKLSAIAPADASDVWLHDRIDFGFDEPIDASGATVTASLAGAPVGATLALVGDRTIAVRLAPAARGTGTLEINLGGVIEDLADNAADLAISAQYSVVAWSRPAIDRGVATETPAIVVDQSGAIIAAWVVDSAAGRRIVVSRYASGGWQALGETLGAGEPASVAVSIDASNRPLVAWVEGGAAHVMRWSGSVWNALPSPGSGTHVVLSASTVAVFGSGIAVRTLSATDTWQVVGDLGLGGALVGEPAIAAGPAIGWIERTGGDAQIRVHRHAAGTWTAMTPIALDLPPAGVNRMSLAASGSQLAVAWDEHGGSSNVIAAIANGTSWSRLGRPLDVDVAGDATAPAIAIDSSARPVVAWRERIEGSDRGVIARWSGSAWTIVGGPQWHGSTAMPSRPSLALYADAPIVGSTAANAMHVARFNGPAVAAVGFARASIAGCSFNAASPTPTLLATGCFTPAPHPGLVPYDIVNELWSDGTKKRRWIGLPDGTSMTASATDAWAAPVGTIMVKEFAIETTPGNPATRRPVETRIFTNTSSGWSGFSYRWRANGSDADLLNDGTFTQDWQLDDGGTYRHLYPSRSQCQSCHHAAFGPLLGVRPQQLQRWFDYGGTIADQIPTLAAAGIGPASTATPHVATHDRAATWEQRSRAYMAANCAHCHNPGNIAIKDLRYTTPLAQTRLCEVITPGSPSQSVVYARVTQRPGMPALGTLIVDPHADLLLARWIAGMTACP